MSFFPEEAESRRKELPMIAKCGACGLYKECRSPKMKVQGKGKKGILVVSDFPKRRDDKKGKSFSDIDGQYLRDALESLDVDLDKDCWLTHALICHPKDSHLKDKNAIAYCRPNIFSVIEERKPSTIVLLGHVAVRSVVGHCWKESVGDIDRWVGWNIPDQKTNAWIYPVWEPNFIIQQNDSLRLKFWLNHLKVAFQERERPYKKVPDYKSMVNNCSTFDPLNIVRLIKDMMKEKLPIAFDYETNQLKSDNAATRYVDCVSMSNYTNTIVFPLTDKKVKDQFVKFLVSDVPKIASNMKFEHRWSKNYFGVEVQHWLWDTMLAAHVLDNRHEITSIKFQSYVKLGQPIYNEVIEKYLIPKKDGGYELNNIKEAPKNELYLYCGLDSLLEWLVAEKQTEEMKHPCHKLFKRN